MSYAFLWAEALLTAILLVATFVALTAGMKVRWIAVLVVFLSVVIPLAPFGIMVACAAKLRYQLEFQRDWFAYSVSLLLVYLMSILILCFSAGRRVGTPPVRRGQRWPRRRIVFALLVTATCGVLTVWSMDRAARLQGEKLKEESRAMTIVTSAPASDSQNAAHLYEQAFARLAADKKSLIDDSSPLESNPPDETQPQASEILRRHELTLKLLHNAVAMPGCRFDYDDTNTQVTVRLPDVFRVRSASRLLWLDARFQQSHGHVENAVDDLSALFRMGKAIRAVPTIISVLLSIAVDHQATRALEDVLPAVTDRAQLAALDIGEIPLMKSIIQNEQARGLGTFGALFSERLPSENGLRIEPMSESAHEFLEGKIAWTAVRIFLLPDDVAAYREWFRTHQSATEYDEPLIVMQNRAFAQRGFVTKLLIPSFSSVWHETLRGRLRHAEATLAIAMTRYRLDHGNFPESIRSLIPSYLDEWPKDSSGTKELQFTQRDNKIVIYSGETCDVLSEQERELPFEPVEFYLKFPN